ncbi:MAG: efflux RND transporter periplasmic adaptor subunit [Pseudomonadota bacterium]
MIDRISRMQLILAGVALTLAAGAGGYGLALWRGQAAPPAAEAGRKVLYWYDPMVPTQHFDKPGKSPFMDMPLTPKYADEAATGDDAGVRIDPARVQSLGLRTARATRGALETGVAVTGVVAFNQRDVTIVQARAGGFVQRVHGRAPGDLVAAGAPLADILVPEWAGAQTEYLAVRRTGEAGLVRAARERLVLLGMPESLIAAVERSGRTQTVTTVTTPAGGVIRTLGVRPGMTLAAGQTLAEINGLGVVWVEAAVPEALAGRVRPDAAASVSLAAYPGEVFAGRVAAILPQVEGESRTLTVRIELPNRDGRLRPGLFAAVRLGEAARPALLVPSEAVIRTGRRTLVMLALEDGRYRPAEVRVGQEADGRTEILAGLSEGEAIVASGQFLIDSEASLTGVRARPAGEGGEAAAAAGPRLHQTTGRIERIGAGGVTMSHDPVPGLNWPAMTMLFRVEDPSLLRGLKVGDRVAFAFDQPPAGPTIRRLTREAGR